MTRPQQNIYQLVEEIIADGKLTREEKKRLDEAIMADGKVSSDERLVISRLLNMLARGEVVMDD
jgi:polyhydroxyalkanoate synthesis regulator phasin